MHARPNEIRHLGDISILQSSNVVVRYQLRRDAIEVACDELDAVP